MTTRQQPGARRGEGNALARVRDASPVSGSSVAAFGAALRQLRAEYGLGTRRLADRSAVSRRAIQYLEDGSIRPRRCTIGALAYGLDPDDPERRKEIIASLVAAAGGEDALAADGRWLRYRKRRFDRGLLNGSVPLPADIRERLEAMQRHDALRREAWALLDRPGARDDGDILDRASALLSEARRLDAVAGGPITLLIGHREIRAGWVI